MPPHTSSLPLLSGVLLAGGRGSRLGGVSKGLLEDGGGQPLAATALALLQASCDEVLINANAEAARWQAVYGLPVIADRLGDHAGPLAGIHAGLLAARHPLVLFLPCDMPQLPAALAPRLLAALLADGADIAIARTPQHRHPLCCLCRRSLAADLAEFIQQGGRRVNAWLAAQRLASVGFDDEAAFANINTPAELAALAPRPASSEDQRIADETL